MSAWPKQNPFGEKYRGDSQGVRVGGGSPATDAAVQTTPTAEPIYSTTAEPTEESEKAS